MLSVTCEQGDLPACHRLQPGLRPILVQDAEVDVEVGVAGVRGDADLAGGVVPNRLMCSGRYGETWARSSGSIG